MIELDIPSDYAERLLGYELFTRIVENISKQVGIKFTSSSEYIIIYDILAKRYLNILERAGYEIDLKPLFYLQLQQTSMGVYLSLRDKVNIASGVISPSYIEIRYGDEIAKLEAYLKSLFRFTNNYRKSYFKGNTAKLTTFIKTFLMKEKIMDVDFSNSTSLRVTKEESTRENKNSFNIGDSFTILRPYVLKTDGSWEIEKCSVFSQKVSRIKACHFDAFEVTVVSKYLTNDNRTVHIAESKDKAWLFVSSTKYSSARRRYYTEWYMAYGNGGPKSHKTEFIPFYRLVDFALINKVYGDKLSGYQLAAVIADGRVKTLSMK